MSKRLATREKGTGENLEEPEFCFCDRIPPELLLEIFSYIKNNELCITVRLVSHKWKKLAERVVNKNFLLLGPKMKKDIALTTEAMQHLPDDVKAMCLGRDYLEHVQFDYEMTYALVWRYAFRPEPLVSMFGGQLVDMIDEYIDTPPIKRTKVGLINIRVNARAFQDYFEDVVEKSINKDPSVSGAKLVDILDCLHDRITPIKIIQENFEAESGNYKLISVYTVHGAWFCSLGNEQHKIFKNHFRNIAHSLRRLVVKRNLYALYDFQKFRQKAMFDEHLLPARSYSYSGFQHFGCLSYGCMNNSEYMSRSQGELIPVPEEDRVEEELDQDEDGGMPEEEQEIEELVPALFLEIKAKLDCPIELAPRAAIMKIPREKWQDRIKLRSSDSFNLEIEVHCNFSGPTRVPKLYTWCSSK
ncbi:uncharacterized protein LOC106668865 [Cimex lectularius]|uniref:F-box domain-containing protein n=1 Tax=Cimex lectularius TaxID=79782 RepID=A0A8I6S0C3_CIMLE|nr:uncharacterized protein LOC106668865 [Cimex lectularius]